MTYDHMTIAAFFSDDDQPLKVYHMDLGHGEEAYDCLISTGLSSLSGDTKMINAC